MLSSFSKIDEIAALIASRDFASAADVGYVSATWSLYAASSSP
ncbi:MAG: hypothetical protein VB137_11390 [Burkholderia sp.]